MQINAVYYQLRYKKNRNGFKRNAENEALMIVLQPLAEKTLINSEIVDDVKYEFYEAVPHTRDHWMRVLKAIVPFADKGERIVIDIGHSNLQPIENVLETYREGKRRRKRNNRKNKKRREKNIY